MKRSRSTPEQIATIDAIGAWLDIFSVEDHGGYREVLAINPNPEEVQEKIDTLVGKINGDEDENTNEEPDPRESMMIANIRDDFGSARQFEAAFMRRYGYVPRLKED